MEKTDTSEQRPTRREYMKKYNKRWNESNPDYKKEWNNKNPNYYRDYYNIKLKNNLEFIKKRRERDMKEYWKDRDKAKHKYQKYILKSGVKERRKLTQKLWVKKNIKYVRKKGNNYNKIRKQNDNNFKIACNLRTRLWFVLRKYSKTGKIYNSKKYGIDYNKIIEHLKPFPKNIKEYHIDHIIPLSRFNLNNPKHIKIAFSPKNHQWLTKEENLIKGNKLIYLK
ncbi:hypothetical protein LCGC14_0791970 [marine sediment metagenome]|uniref:Uncharacterized protein n=1 Tax=marine sediment metagenome TaxID=412755 RepID=A0A0F9QC21_9ZZZZ|nr:hypothetical protein [archaeon]